MKYTEYSAIKKNQSTLKKCSYDSANDEYMTELENISYDFDQVKSKYLSTMGMSEERAKSVDTIIEGKDAKFFLIEFKNGDCKRESRSIHQKVRDSLLIICDICQCHIRDVRKDMTFVLVINGEHTNLSYEDKIAIARSDLAHRECPFMELGKMQGIYFEKVIVYEKGNFDKKFSKRLG